MTAFFFFLRLIGSSGCVGFHKQHQNISWADIVLFAGFGEGFDKLLVELIGFVTIL
jgi:hypothetical protein